MLKSKKKIVIITGASRGLGLSLARKFLQEGDLVFGVSRTKRYWASARKTVSHPENFHLSCFDLTREARVKKFIQEIRRRQGRIDLVINNAGYGGGLCRIEDLSLKEWNRYFEGNLVSAFLVSKHVLPVLKKQKKGLLINISSMAGQRAVPRLSAYSASKFGLLALSQCIAKENSEFGVRAVTVCPGGMNTKMRADLFGKKDSEKQQTTDFVAEIILNVIAGKLKVESGGDIVIRHGKIAAIHPCPAA